MVPQQWQDLLLRLLEQMLQQQALEDLTTEQMVPPK
jgi:hypothetical protein